MKYDEKEKMQMVIQSILNGKTIIENKKTTDKIILFLKLWLIMYSSYSVFIYCIQQYVLHNESYLTNSFFLIRGVILIILNMLMLLILFIFIKRSIMPINEKRFLKMWFLFPTLICIDNISPFILWIINAEFMVQYDAFPLSLIINFISIWAIFSYSSNRKLLPSVILNLLYCLVTLVTTASRNWGISPTLPYIRLLNLVELFNTYGIILIITYIFLILDLQEEETK